MSCPDCPNSGKRNLSTEKLRTRALPDTSTLWLSFPILLESTASWAHVIQRLRSQCEAIRERGWLPTLGDTPDWSVKVDGLKALDKPGEVRSISSAILINKRGRGGGSTIIVYWAPPCLIDP